MSLELTTLLIWRLEFVSLENETRPIDGQKALIVNPSAQVKFCLTMSVARSNGMPYYF